MEVIFTGLRKSGQYDLEAVEMATRAASHRLGAKVLERLLSAPAGFEPTVACGCGHPARFHQMRPKQLLTVLGPITIERPYYVCPHCHAGCSPRDRELDVEAVACSPGVRRMMAVVGSETSFEQSREQLELLAGIEVPAKAVERHAEAIGADIEAREQTAILQAKQLELPEVCAPAVPLLYIEMDGTGIPVVKAETEGRAGKVEGQPAHTREVKFHIPEQLMDEALPAIRAEMERRSEILIDPVVAPEGLMIETSVSLGRDWGAMEEIDFETGWARRAA